MTERCSADRLPSASAINHRSSTTLVASPTLSSGGSSIRCSCRDAALRQRSMIRFRDAVKSQARAAAFVALAEAGILPRLEQDLLNDVLG